MCSWIFILKTIILSLVVISIIIGNSLVITAVALYRKLRKSVSNFFIASLALADFLLAAVILPFSLSKEIFGYWSFGQVMCQIWLVSDVWICTASILHLCAISLDRYIAIAFPLRYPTLMTHKRCRIICLAMWALSFIICFPGLFKWKRTELVSTLSANHSENTTVTTGPQQCDVINDDSVGYTIYSALGSFFIPSIVMTGFYIKIFLMARNFMKQSQRGTLAPSNGDQTMRIHRGISTKLSLYKSAKCAYEMSDLITTTGELASEKNGHKTFYQNSISIDDITHYNRNHTTSDDPMNLTTTDSPLNHTTRDSPVNHTTSDSPVNHTTRDIPVNHTTRDSPVNHTTSDSPVNHTTRDSPVDNTLRRGSFKSERSEAQLLNSLKRPKAKITVGTALNRETRAAKTVAIIVGGFIACWTPFFVCYLLQGAGNIAIDYTLFNVFIWIGYINSLLNPCIYAYFSIDYRHAFKKILKCQVRRNQRSKGVWGFVGSLYVSSSTDKRNSFCSKAHNLASAPT